MEGSKDEMEISKESSESSDSSSSSSWILLDSEENTKNTLPEETTEKIDCPTNESSAIPNSDLSNNKSDAESDGISIISESEFYNIGSSDDDGSVNSNDDNIPDNLKALEYSEISSEECSIIQRSGENSDLSEKTITNECHMISDKSSVVSSSHSDENTTSSNGTTSVGSTSDENFMAARDSMVQELVAIEHSAIDTNNDNEYISTESDNVSNGNDSTDSNDDLTEGAMTLYAAPAGSSDASNRIELHDRKSLHSRLSGLFTIFVQLNILCFTSTIIFAVLVGRIPFSTKQDNTLKVKSADKFVHLKILNEMCHDIYADYAFRDEYVLKTCVEELKLIMTGKMKPEKRHSNEERLNENHNKQEFKYKDKKNDHAYEISKIKPKKNLETNNSINNAKLLNETPEETSNLYHHKAERDIVDDPIKSFDDIYRNKITKLLRDVMDRTKPGEDYVDNFSKELYHLVVGKPQFHERDWINRKRKELAEKEKKLNERETLLLLMEERIHGERKCNYEQKYDVKKFKVDKNRNKENFKNNDKSKKWHNKVRTNFQDENKKNKNKMYKNPLPKSKNSKVHFKKKKNETIAFKDTNKVSGEWYINLSQSRNDIRKKDGKASWWFDRANFRKIKRNKAYWYFQYMFNREDLRYSQKRL